MTMRKVFLIFSMVFLAAACSRQQDTAPATQQSAETQTQVVGARIVSASPAATLQLIEMGAADHLVGVSTYDKLYLPEDKQDLPVIGDYLNFDYEKMLLLKPTHVVVQMADDRLAPRLREITAKHHIELVSFTLNTLEDLFTTAEKLGKIADVSSRTQMMIAAARGELAAVAQKTTTLTKPKTLYIMSKNPMFVVGKNGLWDQMLTIAGADNVGRQAKGDYFPELSTEALISLAPEVLLISAPDEPEMRADDPRIRQWSSLPIPAARNKRIVLVTDGSIMKGSLAVGDNVLKLARMIHPELKDWSPEDEPAPASAPSTQTGAP